MSSLLTDEESAQLLEIVQRGGINTLPLYEALAPIAARTPTKKALMDAIQADLAAAGIDDRTVRGINEVKLWRARNWWGLSEEDKADVRAGRKRLYDLVEPNKHEGAERRKAIAKIMPRKVSGKKVRSVETESDRNRTRQQAQIRILHAEKQYESMHNAPKGKVNIPLKQRVELIQEKLDDIFEIPPETAVMGYGPELCRIFTPSRAEWWLKFCELNEERWKAEVPDLPPMPNKRSIPLAERDLSMTERAMLDWLRKRTNSESEIDGVSAPEVAVAVHCSVVAARAGLTKLCNNGLAAVADVLDRHKMYVAT